MMSGVPWSTPLGVVNTPGTTKSISMFSSQLLRGNPSKGRYQATRVPEQPSNQMRGLRGI
jgi:hypothetical protein